MKAKGNKKTFHEGFKQFILEHCTMKNLRPSTEKHYREMTKYSFYKFFDKYTLLKFLSIKRII